MPFLAPVVGAIGGALGSLGIVGKALVGIGVNLLVGQIQKRQAKKAEKPVGGVEFERDYGENVSRKVACGLVGIAGHDCYVNTYGPSNKFLEQIFVLSDFPSDGLSRIWAGGSLLELEEVLPPLPHARRYRVKTGDYTGLMAFTFYDGTQVAADADMIAHSNPAGRWTADHIGTGITWIKVALTYDQEKLSQFPDFFFEFRGARLYDLRRDSTAGGVGAHRWGDYSTYEFSENPIVQEYNYRRGFTVNGDMFLGMGMSPADLPFDRYAIAMNICDEITEGAPRYRCSIIFDADTDHGDNIEAVMTSCGGIVIDDVSGSWPLIGTDQPIVETFTDDDLISGERPRFQRRRSMAELVNAVSGTYPEPANMWSPAGYDTQTDATYVALDRRTRDVALDLPTVPYKSQANQLASIYFNENRYEATADVVLRPRFQTIKAGDWVRWRSKRFGEFIFMVQARSIRALTSDGPRNVALSLQQRDGAIYQAVGVLPPVIPLPPGLPVYLNELQDYAVIPVLAVGADGRSYPAFRLSWAPIVDATVDGVVFEWWLQSAPENVFTRQVPASSPLAFIQEGIVSKTKYLFRYRIIADRSTSWSQPILVTSLDGGNSDLEVSLSNAKQDVLDRFAELQDESDKIWDAVANLGAAFSLEGAVGEVRRRQLTAQVGSAIAQILEEARVRAQQDEALAQLYTLLSATVGSNAARLALEETARVTSDIALSSSISSLTTNLGDVSSQVIVEQIARSNADTALASTVNAVRADLDGRTAQGLMSFVATAAPAGVIARFSIYVKTSIGDTFKDSGLYLEIYTDNGVQRSRVAIKADQFVVTDGGNSTLPFVFENGVLRLSIANIGTILAGLLTSPNGKMRIDVTQGSIEIYS